MAPASSFIPRESFSMHATLREDSQKSNQSPPLHASQVFFRLLFSYCLSPGACLLEQHCTFSSIPAKIADFLKLQTLEMGCGEDLCWLLEEGLAALEWMQV